MIFRCLNPNNACSADRLKWGHLTIIEIRSSPFWGLGGRLTFRSGYKIGKQIVLSRVSRKVDKQRKRQIKTL
jgi:hypothetical protein